jgi:hypothetical protein
MGMQALILSSTKERKFKKKVSKINLMRMIRMGEARRE